MRCVTLVKMLPVLECLSRKNAKELLSRMGDVYFILAPLNLEVII